MYQVIAINNVYGPESRFGRILGLPEGFALNATEPSKQSQRALRAAQAAAHHCRLFPVRTADVPDVPAYTIAEFQHTTSVDPVGNGT